jgi:transposase
MGYTLHRALVAHGVKNMVVAPQKLCGPKRQKTDALDARALVDRLDRWLRGNRHAFSVVRVPTPEEEQARAQARLRDHLGRMRRMAIDLWRLATKQTTPEKIGLNAAFVP